MADPWEIDRLDLAATSGTSGQPRAAISPK
jgi:hypothetical protein